MASQNRGSNTAVVEMEMGPVSYLSPLQQEKENAVGMDDSTTPPRRASSDEERQDDGMPMTAATEVKQRWNHPRTNIPRVGACFYSFIVMGANDAAYGVSCAHYHHRRHHP
jgi:hypothetical protein